MAVDIPIEIEDIEEKVQSSKTYALDWDNGRIAGYVDELESVRQYIRKALLTHRFNFLIYDEQYGCDIQEIMRSEGVTEEFLDADMQRLVEEAIIYDERILEVGECDYEIIDSESVHISCTVSSIYGEIEVDEVI